MKRPLGLIGIIYLSTLAVIFYLNNTFWFVLLAVLSTLSVVTGAIIKMISRRLSVSNYFITVGCTVFLACLSIILYANYVYSPVIDNYSEKELNIDGYICEEVKIYESSCEYIIKTDTVNGENKKIKINLFSYKDLEIDEFEIVKLKLYGYKADTNQLTSKNIFLSAYTDDYFSIQKTGDYHFSLYSYAIKVRKAMKNSLDMLLPNKYSSLCKAVLLGDKQALSLDVRNEIAETGTTFLIVVSGMHLSVVSSFVLFLMRKITKNRFLRCLSVLLTTLSFMTITGFTPSVIRSGVMLIITYCGVAFSRKSDSLNSLGIAGIVLTVFNPFAVGDIGMILSFTATMGIIMWSDKISSYITERLKIERKSVKALINLISTSISASLWIIPLSTFAFGKISPLVVLVSFFTETLISVVLVCAMISAVLYLCPIISFAAYPFALVAGLASKLFLFIISIFAQIPFCSVRADKSYFYVWIITTIVFVIIGYIIKAKGFYIKSVILLSLSTLIIGWSIYSFVDSNVANLKVYNSGDGITATVDNGDDIIVLSSGGNFTKYRAISNDMQRNHTSLDYLIIPNKNKRYSAYINNILTEFDSEQILVYDINSKQQKRLYEYDGCSRISFGDNLSFKINVNENITNEICNVDGVTCQYVKVYDKTVLLLIAGTDVCRIPEKYRNADFLIIDKLPENYELLSCDTLIYSGKADYYTKNINSIKEINKNIKVTYEDTVTINFSGG